MAVLTTLVAFSLRQASIESGEQIVSKVREWFVDPSLGLHKAIKRANDRTWYALALALGGEGWIDRVTGLWAGADVRGLRDQIQAFLRHAGMGTDALPLQFRKACLEELKQLKARGRLNFETLDPKLIASRAKDFRRYDDTAGLAQEARRAAHQLAVELVKEAPHLAELLQLPLAGDDRPLLVTAFSYFFRQEIAARQELANSMMLDTTERLYAGQVRGFDAMKTFLGGMDTHLHQFYELVVIDLDDIREEIGKAKVVVDDTSRNVQLMMELLVEQQRRIEELQRRDERERAELRQLMQHVLEVVGKGKTAARRKVVVGDVVRQEAAARAAVEELLARSPLTTQVRALMTEALDEELVARREVRPEREAGTRKEGPLGMTFVWVPAGSFFMGSPPSEPSRDVDEVPHHVTLTRGVWISAHAVTRRQWWEVMRAMPDDRSADDHPIEGVSWQEANEFLDVLVERVRLPLRLPTEAEWEYACRAGTVTPFACGFRLSGDLANYHAASMSELSGPQARRRDGTTPVGVYPANGWGLFDMHGNVMEWCLDWYGAYSVGNVVDPRGPARGDSKVLRGGGWWSPAHACRSARRYAARPETTALPAGLRVVMQE